MTEITDAEAAEVLWASSEQGKSAVQAAWAKALDLNVAFVSTGKNMADVRAIVYAAYLAAGWDAEPMEDDEPAHLHSWGILGAQPHTPFVVIGKPVPHTIVLIRCTECGEPDALMLVGEWTVDTPDGRFAVPRIFIACHGLKAADLPALAARYGFERVP
jgi:hypothetical protein